MRQSQLRDQAENKGKVETKFMKEVIKRDGNMADGWS